MSEVGIDYSICRKTKCKHLVDWVCELYSQSACWGHGCPITKECPYYNAHLVSSEIAFCRDKNCTKEGKNGT